MAQLPSLAFAPDTLRDYETIFILRPDAVSDAIADVNNRVRGIIESGGGKVLKVDNWGRRRLAYEIRKQLKGIYLYWQYLGSPEIVAEFERNLRMIDSVIRYMTVRLGADVDPEARPSEFDDDALERAAVTAADEDEIEAAAEESEEAASEEADSEEAASAEASSEDSASEGDSESAEPSDDEPENDDSESGDDADKGDE